MRQKSAADIVKAIKVFITENQQVKADIERETEVVREFLRAMSEQMLASDLLKVRGL